MRRARQATWPLSHANSLRYTPAHTTPLLLLIGVPAGVDMHHTTHHAQAQAQVPRHGAWLTVLIRVLLQGRGVHWGICKGESEGRVRARELQSLHLPSLARKGCQRLQKSSYGPQPPPSRTARSQKEPGCGEMQAGQKRLGSKPRYPGQLGVWGGMGAPTGRHRGIRALFIGSRLQGLLSQLLQVATGGGAEALQGQGHVLLPDEECPHHTFGCI